VKQLLRPTEYHGREEAALRRFQVAVSAFAGPECCASGASATGDFAAGIATRLAVMAAARWNAALAGSVGFRAEQPTSNSGSKHARTVFRDLTGAQDVMVSLSLD
jgi:hypothetical protein